MKVLMVDDSAADRKLCRIWLEQRYGPALRFLEASGGSQGLETCGAEAPDCVLLDYKLPDMTGVEFLAKLSAGTGTNAAPHVGVVMLTGLGNEQVAVEAMKAGAQDYLVKDRMSASNLCMAIERSAEKVGLLRALQTERDRLAAAVLEKEALLQEVHHRVKNNLQVIASLLRLQAGAARDAGAVEALRDSVHRVESMSLIHDQLYGAKNYQQVDMARHVESLTARLVESYGLSHGGIAWRVRMEPLPLTVGQAIPAGLIVNELVSNVLKHAFPDGRGGSLEVSGARLGNRVTLEVRDDGAGFPPPEAKAEGGSKPFGLEIVRILTRQLQGIFQVENQRGAVCRLSFNAV